ncbi:hypothetical protein BDN72DRAFT_848450 [Pluteus cervinus]|uniref:Uncharacterized protein n=1 Tax=Pluteus cervinus TaxID=181527 RepID=A0ACD3AAS5_9AGAR|nr:hypothetical protein BDN72DRAFT_848450 [Pluteus cervinus]
MSATQNSESNMDILDDDIGVDRHAEMDAAVLKDETLKYFLESVKLKVKPPTRFLLTVIVETCDKMDDRYERQDLAEEFLVQNPSVVALLQDAWRLREFKSIRLLKSLRKPVDFYRMPRKSESEMKELVDHFFSKYDEKLEKYLAGPPNQFWKAPPSADAETARFINDLEIPQVRGRRMLLLHDLGNGVVDENVLNALFAKHRSKLLVNTSGSGKTRLLLEGLTKYWGFYLTARVQVGVDALGSSDLMYTLEYHIPNTSGFNSHPGSLNERFQEGAYELNHAIARRQMHQIFAARVLIFENFLKKVKEKFPTRSIHEFRQHWLFLQLRPLDTLLGDAFAELTRLLTDAGRSSSYLIQYSGRLHEKLRNLQEEFDLGEDFFCVLDEGQKASETLTKAFRPTWHPNNIDTRPVLTSIVNTWLYASEFPMIVAGKAIPIDFVFDPPGPAIGLSMNFALTTDTGAFDDRKRQRDYIARYVPGHILESDSGKEFMNRAWRWFQGRYTFTAGLVDELLGLSFESPHKTLNEFVEMFCKAHPLDGRLFVDKEEDVELPVQLSSVKFSNIRCDPGRLSLLNDIVYRWLVDRKYLHFTRDQAIMFVRHGFARARVSYDQGQFALVDEPLVLLAAAQDLCVNGDANSSFEGYVKDRLYAAGGGKRYEELVGRDGVVKSVARSLGEPTEEEDDEMDTR